MSPKLSPKGWPFVVRFFSNEGTEDPHVHISRAGGAEGIAKFWLKSLKFEYLKGFKNSHEKAIRAAAKKHAGSWLQAWETHFQGAKK